MDKTFSRDDLEYVLDNAGIDYSDLNDTYSGRGMIGNTCLSVTFTGKRIQRRLCSFFVELGMAVEANDLDVNAVTELAEAVCTDDLGLDMIVYFPGWKLDD